MSLGGGRARRTARSCRGARDGWSSVATPGVAPIMAALDGHEQRRAVMVLATLSLVELWRTHPPWRLLTRTAEGRPGALWCDRYRARWACPARRLATRFRQPGRAECRGLTSFASPLSYLPTATAPRMPRPPIPCPGRIRATGCTKCDLPSGGHSRPRLSANSTSGTRMYKELAKLK